MRGSRYWMGQTTWFISDAGSREATGADAAHPIPEIERQFRMGPNPTWNASEYHIYNLTDLAAANYAGFLQPGGTVSVHGSATAGVGQSVLFPTVGTAQIDSLVALNRTSTPQHSWEPTCNAIASTWAAASLIGSRWRNTTGTHVGAIAWPTLQLTGKAAKICQMVTALGATPWATVGVVASAVTPVVSEQFVIERLTRIDNFSMRIDQGQHPTAFSDFPIWVDSLDIGSSGGFRCGGSSTYIFHGCVMRWPGNTISRQTTGTLVCIACRNTVTGATPTHTVVSLARGCVNVFYGGYSDSQFLISEGALVEFGIDFMVEGSNMIVRGEIDGSGGFAVFNSPSTGVSLTQAGTIENASTIWGDGNTGVGLVVQDGKINYPVSIPSSSFSITGAGGDFSIGGKTSLHSFDDAQGLVREPIACTWAQFQAAVSAGGFGGNAFDPERGGKITHRAS